MTKLKDISLDKKNANKGTAKGQKLIVNSIQQNGFGRSGLLDKHNRVIAGNKSTEASAEVFGVDVEPVIVETTGDRPVYVKRVDLDLDDPDPNNPARKLAYLDNVTSYFDFTLDPDVVMADIEAGFDFQAIDVNLDDLGKMLERSVAEMLGNGKGDPPPEPPPLIDKAEELQKKWQVKPGDLFQIGPHRLICGDCREPETWERLLGGQKVSGVFTSPPYAEQRKKQYGGVPTDKYVEWWEAVQSNVRANLAEDGSFFVNIKPHSEEGQKALYVFDLVCEMVRGQGWFFIDELCWVRKALPGQWPNRFKNAFEPIYHFAIMNQPKFRPKNVLQPFAVKEYANSPTYDEGGNMTFGNGGTRRSKNFDGALPDNVLEIETGITQKDSGAYHQAYFPPQLPTFFIKAYSDPADLWADPFAGSGTTILAAHNEGRTGAGIEQLPKYCSVILERLLLATGHEPQLVSK